MNFVPWSDKPTWLSQVPEKDKHWKYEGQVLTSLDKSSLTRHLSKLLFLTEISEMNLSLTMEVSKFSTAVYHNDYLEIESVPRFLIRAPKNEFLNVIWFT